MAAFKSASSYNRGAGEPTLVPAAPAARARKLSLALQGGGSLSAFTWGVLDRLLEESDIDIGAISGASAGAINAALLASGLAEGGREAARKALARFWNHLTEEASYRSLMLIGAFSPAGSSVAFGPALQFDPFDLDPLREVLFNHIDFVALRKPACPKLLIATTRVRDGALRLFGNCEMTADVLLASICPPLAHCAVEIEGELLLGRRLCRQPPARWPDGRTSRHAAGAGDAEPRLLRADHQGRDRSPPRSDRGERRAQCRNISARIIR